MENFTLFSKVLTLAQKTWKSYPFLSTSFLIAFAFLAGQNEEKVKEIYAIGKSYIPTWSSSVDQPFEKGTNLYVIVEDDSANLRKEANKQNAEDKLIDFNSKVLFLEKTADKHISNIVNNEEVLGGWFQVTYQDELWYIYAGSVSEDKPEEIVFGTVSDEEKGGITYPVDTYYSLRNDVNIRIDFGKDSDLIKGEHRLKQDEKISVSNNSGAFTEKLSSCDNEKERHWFYMESLDNPYKKGWVYGGCIRQVDEVDVFEEDIFAQGLTYNDVSPPR